MNPEILKPSISKIAEKSVRSYRIAMEQQASSLFEHGNISDEKIDRMVKRLRMYFEAGVLNKEDFVQKIKDCFLIKDKELFVQAFGNIFQPLIHAYELDPIGFEALERIGFNEANNFIGVNEVLSFDINKENATELRLHLPRAKAFIEINGIKEYFVKIMEGLNVVAEAVKNNPEVQIITGLSDVVTTRPRIVEGFGFRVFPKKEDGEENSATYAEISREDFLKRYLL